MNPTRREFLRPGLGGSTLLACGPRFPGSLRPGAAPPHRRPGPAPRAGRAKPAAREPLTDLVTGDPPHAIDFRRAYAPALDQWLACPSPAVFGQRFEHLPIVQAARGEE